MDMWRIYLGILAKNKLPEVLDLFSGCGGLALGFQQEGYAITHGVELMESAARNVNYNLSVAQGLSPGHICGDVTQLPDNVFANDIGHNGCIVIGGPPCQAYSLIGRAKLNSLRDEGTFLDDKRGFLFEDFVRMAIGHHARAVVMENVRQCTAYGDINVPEEVASRLESAGYTVFWTILNAADFGVPQIRERMLLFAVRGHVTPILPQPTHSGKMYGGLYAGQGLGAFTSCQHYLPARQRRMKKPAWVTVEEAIGDLPSLRRRPEEPYQALHMQQLLPYEEDPENDYQQAMRVSLTTVSANVYHNNPRDYQIFARMHEGDTYPQALAIAEDIFQRRAETLGLEHGSAAWEDLRQSIVPPYSVDKFLSKWKRIERDKPCYTLTAHLGLDTYSHIHPWEPRGISVREAARIQSFPDSYIFKSNMGDSFRQIGNSVPPLMARAVAAALRHMLAEQEDAAWRNEQN